MGVGVAILEFVVVQSSSDATRQSESICASVAGQADVWKR
jgi:hypothetical protein